MLVLRPAKTITHYTSLVCEQIRWKKSHELIAEELKNHIYDQRDLYLSHGLDEDTATNNAIIEMGSPIEVGTELDHTHRPKVSKLMLSSVILLILTGFWTHLFLMEPMYNDRGIIENYLVGLVIGLVVMTIAYHIDFILLGRFGFIISIAMLIFTPIFILLFNANINTSMVNFDPYTSITIATSYLPLFFPIAMVCFLYAMKDKKILGLFSCGMYTAFLCGFSFMIPSIFGVLLTITCGLIILTIAIEKNWFGGKKLWNYLVVYVPTLFVVGFFGIFISMTPSIRSRFTVLFHPELEPMGRGFLGSVFREMLRKSNFIGQGNPLDSFEPYGTMSHDANLLQMIYEYGFFVFLIIAVVVLFFLVTGFYLATKQKSMLGLTLSITIMMIFTLQFVMAITQNSGIILFQPVTIPFISYGNFSLIFNATLMGFLLSIFRTGDVVRDRHVYPYKPFHLAWKLSIIKNDN